MALGQKAEQSVGRMEIGAELGQFETVKGPSSMKNGYLGFPPRSNERMVGWTGDEEDGVVG